MTGTRIVTLVSDLLAQPDNSIREVVSRALLCEGLTNLHSGDASVAGMLDASTAGQDATDAADSAARGHARACVWVTGCCGPSGTSAEVWALRGADEVVAWLAGDSAPGVHGVGLFGLVLGITRDMVTEWLTFGVLVLLLTISITGMVAIFWPLAVLVLLLSVGVTCKVVALWLISMLMSLLVLSITSNMVAWSVSVLELVVSISGIMTAMFRL